jgi:hypothetical protein
MPTQATIVLDSGVLLPKEGPHCEIGYFQCEDSCSDITVSIDGEEVGNLPEPFKLGIGMIEVRHLNADGSAKRGGVKTSKYLHKRLLHLKDLYGVDQPVERGNFECVIKFDTGHFCASMVKKRQFKEHKKLDDGSYKHDPNDPPHETEPIAHNLLVYFTLKDSEALELARNNVVFWSSRDYGIKERLDIEIVADNSTAEKFFRHSLSDGGKDGYWLPNQGDPPPTCPQPPCIGFG